MYDKSANYDDFYVEAAWKVYNPSNEVKYENFCELYRRENHQDNTYIPIELKENYSESVQ